LIDLSYSIVLVKATGTFGFKHSELDMLLLIYWITLN